MTRCVRDAQVSERREGVVNGAGGPADGSDGGLPGRSSMSPPLPTLRCDGCGVQWPVAAYGPLQLAQADLRRCDRCARPTTVPVARGASAPRAPG